MLTKLAEYAKMKKIDTRPGFGPQNIMGLIIFHPSGEYLNFHSYLCESNKNGREFIAPQIPQNWLQSGGRANFLYESLENVITLGEKHDFFIKLLSDAFPQNPEMQNIIKALNDPGTLKKIKESIPPKIKLTHPCTLAIYV